VKKSLKRNNSGITRTGGQEQNFFANCISYRVEVRLFFIAWRKKLLNGVSCLVEAEETDLGLSVAGQKLRTITTIRKSFFKTKGG